MAVDPNTDLVTIDEAANLVGVSAVTIARWLKQGRLAGYRVGPRRIRIRRADLARLFTLLPGGKSNDLAEEQPDPAGIVLPPLSAEEIERRLQASREAKALREAVMERRRGEVLPPAWKLISQARRKRQPRA
ncbi:MAG: helix-turn-helix domain-containing protein [Chloroflexi bacterium]|nr:helix-turn-helix domain-containing protein [Chloroflexota bacterium]